MTAPRHDRAVAPGATVRLPFRSPRFDVPEPFAGVFRLVLVDVEVNRERATFLVDVGVRHTAVFQAVAGRFSLRAGERETVSVGLGGDGRVVSRPTHIGELRLGAFQVAGLAARVMTDNACFRIVRERSDCQVDGILGLDVLSRFQVSADAHTGLLTLTRPRKTAGPPPARRPVLGFSSTYPYVVVAGRLPAADAACAVFLDTGSPLSMISTSLADRLPTRVRGRAASPLPFMMGGGGSLRKVPILPALTLGLGSHELELGPVGVVDLAPLGRALGRPVDVLLGCGLLGSHCLHVDFPGRSLSLEPHQRGLALHPVPTHDTELAR